MYDIPAQVAPLYQGDIFRGRFVFPYTPDPGEAIHVIRENAIVPAGQVTGAWDAGTEIILLPAYHTEFAVVLSNTCDIV